MITIKIYNTVVCKSKVYQIRVFLEVTEKFWLRHKSFVLHTSSFDAMSQVWMSYAQFEMSATDEGNVVFARQVYDRANQSLRGANEKEERVLLLEAWRDFETQHGDNESLEKVMQKMPRRVKKRQRVQADDGVSYLFFWCRAVLFNWWWWKVVRWYKYLAISLFFLP